MGQTQITGIDRDLDLHQASKKGGRQLSLQSGKARRKECRDVVR
jgi:hypothetical protein